MRPQLRIALLECDELVGETKREHGSISDVYKKFLEAGASQLEEIGLYERPDLAVSSYDVVNKQEYPVLENIDAVFLTGRLKRIILTNSLAALIDYVTDTDETVHTESTRATNILQPPYRSLFEAYTAAKVSTLNLTEQWAESEKSAFDLVHIAPGHVFGPNELVTSPEELLLTGTNRIILIPVVTGKAYIMEPGVTVHLDDVAEAHVRALNPSIPCNHLYVLSSGEVAGIKLDDCFEIVARSFPEHVGNTLLNNGSLPSPVFKVDASESARTLGMDFISYEQQVRDAVGYYLECFNGDLARQRRLDRYSIMELT
ncbi:hypothetical protein BJ878DRAFT_571280 [Calycina marina]|uniref:Uncharacterized protein n=1 Tax=Calycina marina TaxID=1763456 RepID=A0A9P7YW22_9HELO|nr:hypothetical protein BJ878DRAFT_571280 [Calycina marina]